MSERVGRGVVDGPLTSQKEEIRAHVKLMLDHFKNQSERLGIEEVYLELRAFPKGERKIDGAPPRTFISTNDYLEKVLTKLNRFIKITEEMRLHLGVGINPRKSKSGTSKDIAFLSLVLIDIDSGNAELDEIMEKLEKLEIEPFYVVETSPGRYQITIKIKPTPTSESATYKKVTEKLAEIFGGDKQVKDIARIGRLAGGVHWEKGFVSRLVLANANAKEYDLNELASRLGIEKKEKTKEVQMKKVKPGERWNNIPHEAKKKIASILSKYWKSTEAAKRYELVWSLAGACALRNIDPVDVAEIVTMTDELAEEKTSNLSEKLRAIYCTYSRLGKADESDLERLSEFAEEIGVGLSSGSCGSGTEKVVGLTTLENILQRQAKHLGIKDYEKDANAIKLLLKVVTKRKMETNGETKKAGSGLPISIDDLPTMYIEDETSIVTKLSDEVVCVDHLCFNFEKKIVFALNAKGNKAKVYWNAVPVRVRAGRNVYNESMKLKIVDFESRDGIKFSVAYMDDIVYGEKFLKATVGPAGLVAGRNPRLYEFLKYIEILSASEEGNNFVEVEESKYAIIEKGIVITPDGEVVENLPEFELPDAEELKDALLKVEIFKLFYPIDVAEFIYKFAILSPFSFSIKWIRSKGGKKTYEKLISPIFVYGLSRTGKTTITEMLVKDMWNWAVDDEMLRAPGIKSSASFGRLASRSFFPVVIQEGNQLVMRLKEGDGEIYDFLKNIVESKISRSVSKQNSKELLDFPALSAIAITSNLMLPNDPALKRRFLLLEMNEDIDEDREYLFELFVTEAEIEEAVKVLGKYVISLASRNPQLFVEMVKESEAWTDVATAFEIALWNLAGLKPPRWIFIDAKRKIREQLKRSNIIEGRKIIRKIIKTLIDEAKANMGNLVKQLAEGEETDVDPIGKKIKMIEYALKERLISNIQLVEHEKDGQIYVMIEDQDYSAEALKKLLEPFFGTIKANKKENIILIPYNSFINVLGEIITKVEDEDEDEDPLLVYKVDEKRMRMIEGWAKALVGETNTLSVAEHEIIKKAFEIDYEVGEYVERQIRRISKEFNEESVGKGERKDRGDGDSDMGTEGTPQSSQRNETDSTSPQHAGESNSDKPVEAGSNDGTSTGELSIRDERRKEKVHEENVGGDKKEGTGMRYPWIRVGQGNFGSDARRATEKIREITGELYPDFSSLEPDRFAPLEEAIRDDLYLSDSTIAEYAGVPLKELGLFGRALLRALLEIIRVGSRKAKDGVVKGDGTFAKRVAQAFGFSEGLALPMFVLRSVLQKDPQLAYEGIRLLAESGEIGRDLYNHLKAKHLHILDPSVIEMAEEMVRARGLGDRWREWASRLPCDKSIECLIEYVTHQKEGQN